MNERKNEIRAAMKAWRKALSADERAYAATVVCDKLATSPEINGVLDPLDGCGSVCAVYLASRDEIDLKDVIKTFLGWGVTVVAPRWNGKIYELAKLKSMRDEDLRRGPMGILEPKDAEIVQPKAVDVWLVPGLAFTKGGVRLGYGGGWYDRLLAGAAKHSLKFGIAHGFQVVGELPSEPHDIRLDGIVDDMLDHPLVTFGGLPDGCRAHISINQICWSVDVSNAKWYN